MIWLRSVGMNRIADGQINVIPNRSMETQLGGVFQCSRRSVANIRRSLW